MVIDHICFAVKNIEEGVSYWDEVFGYRQMTNIVINSLQKVKVVFLEKQGSLLIKLIEPLEDNRPGEEVFIICVSDVKTWKAA